jgi:hypothetical protein
MAEIKYYKKLSPSNHPVLSSGVRVEFTTLDLITGYFATDSEVVQAEFARFNREQRYGIVEISAEEFASDYLEKKNHSPASRQLWREEIGKNGLNRTSQLPATGRNVAVEGGVTDIPAHLRQTATPSVATLPDTATPGKTTEPPSEFKPTQGKRPPRKQQ